MAQDSQQVHDDLSVLFDQTAPTEAQSLVLINAAIGRSWPSIKLTQRDTAVCTVTAATFIATVTSLSQTPARDMGFAQIWVADIGTRPEVRLRDVRQREELGTWYLHFSERVVRVYAGQSVSVVYQYPHARISAPLATGDLNLPYDYLLPYCSWLWATRQLPQAHDANVAGFRDMIAIFEEQWRESLHRNMVLPMGVVAHHMPDRTE
jgi:hypothetical protein